MTETQKRIKALKKQLPSAKGKVVAMATSLLLAAVMLTSVSFAWVTLSQAPELGGVRTTISANGNLEIALSDFDGLEPNKSGAGDSFGAAESVHAANTSWGNLINLSGNYGLENLVLRPAKLDPSSSAYLSSVVYGEDGRVDGMTTEFGFTTWREKDVATHEYAFVVPTDKAYGVRAISSVAYPDGKSDLQKRLDVIKANNRSIAADYLEIMNDDKNRAVIQNVVQVHVDDSIHTMIQGYSASFADKNKINPDCGKYLDDIEAMLNSVYDDVVIPFGKVLVDIANLQQSFKSNTYTPYTLDTLLAADAAELTANNVKLKNTLETYKTNFKGKIEEAQSKMTALQETRKNGGTVKWLELKDVMALMIHIDSVLIEGLTANQISRKGTGAISYVNSLPQDLNVQIQSGALYVFEELSGARMANIVNEGKEKGGMMIDVEVKASVLVVGVDREFTGFVTTKLALTTPSKLSKDLDATETMGQSQSASKPMEAQDTYGMVLDLWFRTNAGNEMKGESVLLTLNGVPKIEYTEKPMTIILDGESEPRAVYVYKCFKGQVENGSPVLEDQLVYKNTVTDEQGNETTHYYDCTTREVVYVVEIKQNKVLDANGNPVIDEESGKEVIEYEPELTDTPITDSDVTPKMETIETVIGYESANRVWADDELDIQGAEMSATQGSGSCYIFYANTPEESARSLELLSHMKFAFLDAEGNLLAEGAMDVDHVYQNSGKHIVPLVITDSDYYVLDEQGNKIYGITRLTKNVAARISVVVYLDGEKLENNMVLSSGSIQGSLNLQFDTEAELEAMGSLDLALKTQSLTASINKTIFGVDAEADKTPAVLTANVEGLNANTVQAVFMRRVNATQGSRMDPIDLAPADVNKINWKADVKFDFPGTYVLNELIVDGVAYPLQSEPIVVEVKGFEIRSVRMPGETSAFTTASSVSRELYVQFAANANLQPKEVIARFMKPDGNSITVPLTNAGQLWQGTVTFPQSGEYTLEYLTVVREEIDAATGKKVDKEYYFEIANQEWRVKFTAYLGLKTSVELTREGGLDFIWKPTDGMQTIKIRTQIYTDTGDQMRGLDNVQLYYLPEGSSDETDGFSAPLQWKNGAYEGNFEVSGKYGSFRFSMLKIGNDRITQALSADEFFVKSPDPPKFVEHLNKGATIVLDDTTEYAYYYATLQNALGYTVRAVFVSPDGETVVYAPGAIKEGKYQFAFPKTNGKKNGQWKMQEIRVYGLGETKDQNDTDDAFKDRAYYPLNPKDDTVYTVISEFTIYVDNMSVGNQTTTQFMSEQSLVGLTDSDGKALGVNIKLDADFEWLSNLTISDVKITYTYDGGSKTNGGYEFDAVGHPDAVKTFTLKLASGSFKDGQWVIESGSVLLAGNYKCTVSFKVSGANAGETTFGENKTYSNKLAVYSAKPSLTVSSATTNGNGIGGNQFTTRVGSANAEASLEKRSNTYDATKNELTVYIHAVWKTKKLFTAASIYYNYNSGENILLTNETTVRSKTLPQIVLRLDGVSNKFDSATVTLKGNQTVTATITRGSQNTGPYLSTQFAVGELSGSNTLTYKFTNRSVFGTATVEKITIIVGDVVYDVTLAQTLTIKNPY